MKQGGVYNQRYGDADIYEFESVEQEYAWAGAGWCQAIEDDEEGYEPEDRVNGLDGEFGGREEEGKEGDVTGDG